MLCDNVISPRGAAALSDALQTLPKLQELDLSGNMLGDKGLHGLLGVITAGRLEVLHLADNGLGPAAGITLAAALPQAVCLRELGLADNTLADAGCMGLAGALAAGTRVQVLELGRNGIGAAGASALADAIIAGANLEALLLDGNPLTDAGASSLAACLKGGTMALRTLHIQSAGISSDGGSALAAAVAAQRGSAGQLGVLRLQGNFMGDCTKKKLRTACKGAEVELEV